MEKKILYHIGLYGFRKLIVYVIKDNGIVRLSLVLMERFIPFPRLEL